MNPICLKTGYRGKTRPSCIFVHQPDLTGKNTYDCPTCGATWYRIAGQQDNERHPDQNWTRNKPVDWAAQPQAMYDRVNQPTLDEETLAAAERMLGIGPIPADTFTIPSCKHGISCAFECHDCSYVYDKFELCL